MRCYLSPLRWREFCLSARVWCNVFAFSIPLYMTGWQHWRELSSQRSHILSPRSAAPVFWKTHNRKLQQRRRYPHLGPDVLIYARWPNRLAGGGVRTEGHKRKQLPRLYFIASMTVRSAYNAPPFPSLAPQSNLGPAVLLVWTLLGSAVMQTGLGSQTLAGGFLGWPGERTAELKAR